MIQGQILEYQAIIALDPKGSAIMTRDMEIIRAIVSKIQSWKSPTLRKLEIEGYDSTVVGRHVEMLIQAGYVEGKVHKSSMGTELTAFVNDLTWEGHDFAAAVQNEGVWNRIKETLSPRELATVPLTMIKKIGSSMLEA